MFSKRIPDWKLNTEIQSSINKNPQIINDSTFFALFQKQLDINKNYFR